MMEFRDNRKVSIISRSHSKYKNWDKVRSDRIDVPKSRIVDIVFIIFMVTLSAKYYYFIGDIAAPTWDSSVYLTNARDWLTGNSLLEVGNRAPLISWIIAGIWSFTGESWSIVKHLQAVFTLGAGVILYMLVRKFKGSLFALGVAGLTMLNADMFFWSSQILTEGLALFFLVLSVYLFKMNAHKPRNWLLAGIVMGLTYAARFPIMLQSIAIFIVEFLIRRNFKLFSLAFLGFIVTFAAVTFTLTVKVGDVEGGVASASGSLYSFLSTSFYLTNSLSIWGWAFLLVPLAFLFKRTYTDSFNYTFIAWFIVAMIYWSSIEGNFETRFTVQFMPAVYYLAILAIENFAKSNLSINGILMGLRDVKKSIKDGVDFLVKPYDGYSVGKNKRDKN